MLSAAGAGTAQVAVRAVEQVLVAGVGVDGRHQALDDAELVVEDLRHRGEAVGRARGVGDHRVLRGVVVALVDAHHDGDVLVLGGRRDDDLLGATVDVGLRLGRVGEEAGRLDHDVDAAPVQGARVALGVDLEGLAGGGDVGVGVRHVAVEATEGGVVLQQRRQSLVVRQVVDGDDLDVGAGGDDGAEEVAADPAEPVDTYSNSHCGAPACQSAGARGTTRPYRPRSTVARATCPTYVRVTRRSRWTSRPRRASPASARPRCRGCRAPRRACRPSPAAAGSGRRSRPW